MAVTTGSAEGRPDHAWFGDPAMGFCAAAVDLLRLGGLEAVSLPAVALRTGRSVTEVAAEFSTTEVLRTRVERYLAITVCEAVLAANEIGGSPAAASALMALSERDPAVFRQALTGSLFSAGEDRALDVVRVFLPDAEIPDDETGRLRWFDYLRSHLHAAILTAREFADPDQRIEILTGANRGALTVSELINSVSSAPPESEPS